MFDNKNLNYSVVSNSIDYTNHSVGILEKNMKLYDTVIESPTPETY